MKIAFDLFPTKKLASGTGVYAEQLFVALRVLTADTDDAVIGLRGPGFIKKVGLLPALANFLIDLVWYQVVLPLYVWAIRADVVHFTANAGSLMKLTPQVITVHDAIFVEHISSYKRHFIWYTKVFWIPSIRRADKLTTISHHSAQQIQKLLGCGASVVYNGPGQGPELVTIADATEVKSVQTPGQYVLYVGAVTQHKNLTTLLRAFRKVVKAYPEVTLVLAGGTGRSRDPWAEELGMLLTELGIEEQVVITGSLSAEKLAQWYAAASVVVLPSLQEGFGMTPLEAVAFGKLTIVSDIPVLHEILGDAALYADPYQPEQWATCIGQVLGQASGWQDEAIKQKRGQYSWHKTARDMLNIYRQVLKTSDNNKRWLTKEVKL